MPNFPKSDKKNLSGYLFNRIGPDVPVKSFYLNEAQQRSAIIGAREEYAIWGRGTGKSTGLIAPRLLDWWHQMPQSLIGIVASTYAQHLTRTLPAIVMGLEKMGIKRDRDFFIGSLAPEEWKWKKPFFTPISTRYFIHFRTGAGAVLISQDRPGSANGLSLDGVVGDEAKYLDEEKFNTEIIPAMRGNYNVFGHLGCYQGILLCTDMPDTSKGEWLLNKDGLVDQKRIDLIIDIQADIATYYESVRDPNVPESTRKRYAEQISAWFNQINALRRGNSEKNIPPLTYVSYASSLSNIDVLRPEWFDTQKRLTTPFQYNTQILNIKPSKVLNGFYPALSDKVHGYTAYNNEYLDTLGYDFEAIKKAGCKADSDIHVLEWFDIALDYGGSFNCIMVGQKWPNEYRFVKNFWGDASKKLKDVVMDFKKYYENIDTKRVRFFYDNTAIGTDASRVERYYEEVIRLLKSKEHGSWHVKPVYVGQQPTHEQRYNMWNKILTKDIAYGAIPFKYNEHNCADWLTSCSLAKTKRTEKGLEKDKSDEKKRTKSGAFAVAQERATHLSDAGDTLLYGVYVVSPAKANTSSAPVGGAMTT